MAMVDVNGCKVFKRNINYVGTYQGCNQCGQKDHLIRHCPKLYCFYCSKQGHFKKECPSFKEKLEIKKLKSQIKFYENQGKGAITPIKSSEESFEIQQVANFGLTKKPKPPQSINLLNLDKIFNQINQFLINELEGIRRRILDELNFLPGEKIDDFGNKADDEIFNGDYLQGKWKIEWNNLPPKFKGAIAKASSNLMRDIVECIRDDTEQIFISRANEGMETSKQLCSQQFQTLKVNIFEELKNQSLN
jgi:hypothetical protein